MEGTLMQWFFVEFALVSKDEQKIRMLWFYQFVVPDSMDVRFDMLWSRYEKLLIVESHNESR